MNDEEASNRERSPERREKSSSEQGGYVHGWCLRSKTDFRDNDLLGPDDNLEVGPGNREFAICRGYECYSMPDNDVRHMQPAFESDDDHLQRHSSSGTRFGTIPVPGLGPLSDGILRTRRDRTWRGVVHTEHVEVGRVRRDSVFTCGDEHRLPEERYDLQHRIRIHHGRDLWIEHGRLFGRRLGVVSTGRYETDGSESESRGRLIPRQRHVRSVAPSKCSGRFDNESVDQDRTGDGMHSGIPSEKLSCEQ